MAEIDNKERIKQAAHELVRKYSIRSVSMDDIANSVGMSKKTLYQYFQDKDEVEKEVVESVTEESKLDPSVIYEMQKYHPAAYQVFHQHKT